MNYTAIEGGVCAAKGFTAAGIHSGIRPAGEKLDLALILSEAECSAAAVYTQNKVKGAPLLVTKQNLENGTARGILCNSGNANTCAPGGLELAQACCALCADATGLAESDFVIASTGVIGQAMPKQPFEDGIPKLARLQSRAGGKDAALAIMTTDTVKKEFALEGAIGGQAFRIGGICKGSGMINPNMATMLAFVTTDAAITPPLLQKALNTCIATTLNQICVDGDTSTNDMAVVLANGQCGAPAIDKEGPAYNTFCNALESILQQMAKALAADGEGATKLLQCHVAGATNNTTARAIAKTVIASDLFKSAMFGQDANWGRALCAIGYTPGNFAVDDVSLVLKSAAGEVLVCQHSAHLPYSEDEAAKILAESEIDILIDMHSGNGNGTAWGCDLTYEYVKINGDYRT